MEKQILNIQALAFSALAHPLRIKILKKLRHGACCVCKLIPDVGGEQSNVSHHLAILKRANIVFSEKRGLEVWYDVIDPKIYDILDLMNTCIVSNLRKDKDILESLTREFK